jgi:hypothetical protein
MQFDKGNKKEIDMSNVTSDFANHLHVYNDENNRSIQTLSDTETMVRKFHDTYFNTKKVVDGGDTITSEEIQSIKEVMTKALAESDKWNAWVVSEHAITSKDPDSTSLFIAAKMHSVTRISAMLQNIINNKCIVHRYPLLKCKL